MTSNEKIAVLLKKVAAVFRIKEGETFRYKAYINAANTIENLSESVEELYEQDLLDNIPGIGESLKGYIQEYFQKGTVRHFESIYKKVPQGMFALMIIRGVGPITSYKIAKKFKLTDEKKALKELKKIISQGGIEKIPGFTIKTTNKIKQALDINLQTKVKRLKLSEALPIAQKFLDYLNKNPVIKESEMLGSLRRKLPTIGDIDLAISTTKPKEALDYALKYPDIKGIVNRGEKLSHVKLKSGYEVDIKLSTPDQWGSLLQHYTGSKMHNIKLRTLAMSQKLSLSEYGIKKGNKNYNFKTEKDFYQFLGLPYIPPEMREDKGEIELAKSNQLPNLINLSDIKGDLHLHTNFDFQTSHDLGVSSVQTILEFAQKHHYEYLGLSDHNPKFTGLTEKQKQNIIVKRNKWLKEESKGKDKAKILLGLEVDIRPDGDLALSDSKLALLDYAIVSIHSSFNLSSEKNTARILDALSHPQAKILGHPTGRMINGREPITADWNKIFNFCAQHHKILEINASPSRLDLPADLIIQAASLGVKFVINTDSHEVGSMSDMQYGVWQARKAGLSKKQVINTYSYPNLLKVLKLKH